MARKRKFTGQVSVRLDDEIEQHLTTLENRMKLTRANVIREAIKQTASDTSQRRIADALENINRNLSTAATVAHIEQISKQLMDMAEANNSNANAIALGINRLKERLP